MKTEINKNAQLERLYNQVKEATKNVVINNKPPTNLAENQVPLVIVKYPPTENAYKLVFLKKRG